jgi:hypothetical protein
LIFDISRKHIYKGEKIIKSDRRACIEALGAIASILYFIKTKEIIENRYAFDFLYNLSTAMVILLKRQEEEKLMQKKEDLSSKKEILKILLSNIYRSSINPDYKMKNADELNLIKNIIIKEIFPSLF